MQVLPTPESPRNIILWVFLLALELLESDIITAYRVYWQNIDNQYCSYHIPLLDRESFYSISIGKHIFFIEKYSDKMNLSDILWSQILLWHNLFGIFIEELAKYMICNKAQMIKHPIFFCWISSRWTCCISRRWYSQLRNLPRCGWPPRFAHHHIRSRIVRWGISCHRRSTRPGRSHQEVWSSGVFLLRWRDFPE